MTASVTLTLNFEVSKYPCAQVHTMKSISLINYIQCSSIMAKFAVTCNTNIGLHLSEHWQIYIETSRFIADRHFTVNNCYTCYLL